jgi:hypothetical protein
LSFREDFVMNQASFNVFALACLGLLSACEVFDPGSLIATPRVLGARVEVSTEPERAAPKPGELAEIRWIMAWPRDSAPVQWAFAACLPEAVANGACAVEPLAFTQGSGLEPSFSLQVPSAALLGESDHLVVLGLICDVGRPALDVQGAPHCTGDRAHGTRVELDVAIDDNDRGNLNPELDNAYIALDERTWDGENDADAGEDCAANAALPQIKADGKKHTIRLELGVDVRELYTMPDDNRSQLEALQLSQFVTAGELAGQYSFVDASDPSEQPELSITWHAPEAKEVAAAGERVRFYFVLRDLRGGLVLAERALCAVR